MSSDWIHVIPTDPFFVPAGDRARALLGEVRRLVPEAEDVSMIASDHVEFVAAGSNFEAVRCPHCGTELELDWWKDRMDAAYETDFTDRSIRLPCCARVGDLNELTYDWPQGFARWRIEAFNPGRGPFQAWEIRALRAALGHDIRVIWTHM